MSDHKITNKKSNKMPNSEKAIVPKSKILDYILSLSHRDGSSKAKFFMLFGFSIDQWKKLENALKDHAIKNNVTKIEQTFFGTRYVIEGSIYTPDNRNPKILSVWFVKKNTDIPCFVTSYPKKERKNDK